TTVAAARDGAAMTANTVETVGERGGDADGLRGSPMKAPAQGILGRIMPRKRPDPAAIRQDKCLPISESVIESSETVGGGPRSVAIREIPDNTPVIGDA
ncbi:MAG: hypothetical protein ACYS5V_16300, partial [Planctomycetota bacterium]